MNAITYVFWWHKPLGVHVPIRIYFETAVEKVDVEDADAEPGITAFYFLSEFGGYVGKILATIRDLFREANDSLVAYLFFLLCIWFISF